MRPNSGANSKAQSLRSALRSTRSRPLGFALAIACTLGASYARPALALQPVIGTVLIALAALPGALFTRMSGSGATTFAITENLAAAENLAEKFKSQFGDHGWIAVVPV